jgi:type I restriction enzyme S subunit
MIDVNPNHLETITGILAAHVPECEVRAFGSRVTWTSKDYSDLDLAVVGGRALDPDALRRMKEAFETSNLPFRVDVLDWHAISAAFRKVIEKKYEVVQKGKRQSLGRAPYVSLTSQRGLSVALPPIDVQRAIARILGTLDDKIELNRRMNETLEAMARALFKSWFVHLDSARVPVNDLIVDGAMEIGDGYRAKSSELGAPGLPFVRAGDLKNGIDTRGADTLLSESVSHAGNKISQPGDVAFHLEGNSRTFCASQ